MLTIILPGYSPSNYQWAHKVRENLVLDHPILVHEWNHWKKGGALSLKTELECIYKKVKKEKINIIAKSVGTRVAMRLTNTLKDSIKKIILCGVPTRGESKTAQKVYSEGFSNLDTKNIVVFQNGKDPFASHSDIVEFVGKLGKDIQIIKMPRSDHNYPYFGEFQKFLEEE